MIQSPPLPLHRSACRLFTPALKALWILLCLTSLTLPAYAQWTPDDSKGFTAHDPVMIKQEGIYYLFVTGGGIAQSSDMKNWTRIERVPRELSWVTEDRSEEHTSELQSRPHLVCRLLLEK